MTGSVYMADGGRWVAADGAGWLPGSFPSEKAARAALVSADRPVRHLLLQGVVGSHAYGLATPESDVDRLGVYAAPTRLFHGLRPPVGKQGTEQTHGADDITLHEAGKFALLALQCNPTVTELLWLPRHEVSSPEGERLIEIREAFLSRKLVKDAYFGYATQQLKRMRNYTADRPREEKIAKPHRPEKVAKHTRHLVRLLFQGMDLLKTGALTVHLNDETAEVVRWHGEWAAEHGTAMIEGLLESAPFVFDEPSPLPERPDESKVEEWLQYIRAVYYEEP